MGKGLGYFPKENIQMDSKYMKRRSISLFSRKMQIKTQRETISHQSE